MTSGSLQEPIKSSVGQALHVLFQTLYIQVLLVIGGLYSYFLDSTEVFNPTVGSWAMAGAKLPRPMCCSSAININDRVLIFGIFLKILIHLIHIDMKFYRKTYSLSQT